jgi:radical SAM superfamily enzyme YgiQ (UPF0313 family)
MINKRNKLAILINPPIYDTQYWARWSMPHGLLKVATWLKNEGYDLKLIDCLNPYGKDSGVLDKTSDYESFNAVRKEKKSMVVLASTKEVPVGFGENEIAPSYKLQENEKWKYHFGMPLGILENHLSELHLRSKKKNYQSIEIWITSIMTYWWESTRDVIKIALNVFPDAKIRVGGIYPTLAPDHAQLKLGVTAERIKGNQLDINDEKLLSKHLIVENEVTPASNLDLLTDLYDDDERPPYTILTSSRGCPHICAYCASNILNDGTKVRSRGVSDVISEIKDKFRKGTKVFCFYEDNLLMNMKEFKEVLKAVMSDKTLYGIKIYAPEGIEIGVAMSDRKRFLLKYKDEIIGSFSVHSHNEESSEGLKEYFARKNNHEKISINLEEDLIDGIQDNIIEKTNESISFLLNNEKITLVRKIMKNGRHEITFESDNTNSKFYLVGVPEIIYLMRKAGFERIYLPLETIKKETNARWNRSWNSNLKRFQDLLTALKESGFDLRKQKVNTFVMFGLPGEDIEEIYDTALYASENVGSVIPMLFTPVPSTMVFEEYREYFDEHGFDLQHLNGKLFPMFHLLKQQKEKENPNIEFKITDYLRLESFMQRLNIKINGQSVNIYADTKVSRTFRKVFSDYQSILRKV